MNGIENSTALLRTNVIVRLATATSASRLTISPIIPFQFPFASLDLKLNFFLPQITHIVFEIKIKFYPNFPSLTILSS
jgi:hypothetical protein